MIKLAVSDFDGTLLPYTDSNLSEKLVSCIDELLNMEIVFAVSSGRTYSELVRYMPQYKDRIYFTCCDGALTVKNGNVLYSRRIEISDIEMFFKHKNSHFSFVLHGAFQNYYYGNIPESAKEFSPTPVGNVYEIKDKIFKITSFGDTLLLPENSGLRNHWDGGDLNVSQYVNRYCNKGTALSDLQVRLMFTKYDTVILGDR